jgi:acetyl-CoA acetyltransferase
VEDVAIIGVGLHPFGRFPGKSAIDMGVDATHMALRDGGLHWDDVQIAVGGSSEVSSVDAMVNRVGLTGFPVLNV